MLSPSRFWSTWTETTQGCLWNEVRVTQWTWTSNGFFTTSILRNEGNLQTKEGVDFVHQCWIDVTRLSTMSTSNHSIVARRSARPLCHPRNRLFSCFRSLFKYSLDVQLKSMAPSLKAIKLKSRQMRHVISQIMQVKYPCDALCTALFHDQCVKGYHLLWKSHHTLLWCPRHAVPLKPFSGPWKLAATNATPCCWYEP